MRRRGELHLNDGSGIERAIFERVIGIKRQMRAPPSKRGLDLIFVGVAGKIYVGIHLLEKVPDPVFPALNVDQHSFYWNYNDAKDLNELKSVRRTYYRHMPYAESLEDWFRKDQKVFDAPDVFCPDTTPVFCIYNNTLITNPILQDVKFQKVLDAQAIFQELSMFLVNNNEVDTSVSTSDEDLLVAKGFNEASFKGPTRIKRRKLKKSS